jgi:hypothetical protein
MVEESTWFECLREDHQGGQGPYRTVEPEEEEEEEEKEEENNSSGFNCSVCNLAAEALGSPFQALLGVLTFSWGFVMSSGLATTRTLPLLWVGVCVTRQKWIVVPKKNVRLRVNVGSFKESQLVLGVVMISLLAIGL